MLRKMKSRLFHVFLRIFLSKSDPGMEDRYLREAWHFWKLTSKYNASHHTDDDMTKMQYTLLRENHVIEKGMSMRNPRKGFGQKKVENLIERLNKYWLLYGSVDKDFLSYPLATINTYIEYTEDNGVEIPVIRDKFEALKKKIGLISLEKSGGINETTKEDILQHCNKSFESLLESRHSIRYFSGEPVSQELILKALKLAQKTPSACNRQGWKSHVFVGDKSIELIKWQAGGRGFEEECRYSILVTADLKAFLWHEVHQAYVDGGLYAMNLINAIHSIGLGCIPLSCGFEYEKLKQLDKFEIPDNEVPILIVAFGHLQDNFNYAVSSRKELIMTNTFHI